VTVDLYEAKDMAAVMKSILALGQLSASIPDYHGPTISVSTGRNWEKKAEVVDATLRISSRESTADEVDPRPSPRRATSDTASEGHLLDVSGLDEAGAAKAWMGAVLAETFNDEATLHELLRSGTRLCKLVNAVSPGIVSRVNDSDRPFVHMENISHFTSACTVLNVLPVFNPPDLYEEKNMKTVVQCIHSLARAARARGFGGPLLAPASERMQL